MGRMTELTWLGTYVRMKLKAAEEVYILKFFHEIWLTKLQNLGEHNLRSCPVSVLYHRT